MPLTNIFSCETALCGQEHAGGTLPRYVWTGIGQYLCSSRGGSIRRRFQRCRLGWVPICGRSIRKCCHRGRCVHAVSKESLFILHYCLLARYWVYSYMYMLYMYIFLIVLTWDSINQNISCFFLNLTKQKKWNEHWDGDWHRQAGRRRNVYLQYFGPAKEEQGWGCIGGIKMSVMNARTAPTSLYCTTYVVSRLYYMFLWRQPKNSRVVTET